jgi:tRNA nucleotidyltransferase (CCA-adding enzyme)
MAKKLPGALPAGVGRRVAAARRLARDARIPLYLVGGAVRDLLLGLPVRDVDLVVESGAETFAEKVARELGAELKLHRRFGTAVVLLPNGDRLDFATARAEDYERSGALPRVRPASITEDMLRRDFTVNAMALEIASGRPKLLDPAGGRDDLDRKVIRFLHPRSAFDDATRAFRAVRYANRLGFAIAKDTRRSILEAVAAGAADALSGDRLRREIALLFSEERRAAAVREMVSLRISRTIHPGLRFDAATGRRLRAAELLAARDDRATWLLYLLAWMGEASEREAGEIAARLNLSRASGRIVRAWPEVRRRLLSPAKAGDGAGDPDSILAAAAEAAPPVRRRILGALAPPDGRLQIGGRDLVAAGIPAGPAIGRALSATRAARLEGAIRKEDELAFALKAARS